MFHFDMSFVISLCLLFALPFCNGISTMAIDLGTDVTKVAVVRPGVPMEIVLDGASKRTICTLVLLKEGNRLFGNGAVASATRDPTIVFAELPSIVGKTLDHPTVIEYQKRYPYHNLTFSYESRQLAFVVNGKEFTVETLLAMFLEYVKKTAEAFAESQMKTAVITVPSYFTQAERRAMLRSAGLANIEVIQLIDDNVAVALDYIRPRIKLAQEKPIYLFFDVGATATTATLVSYQMAQVKGEPSGEHPHVYVLGAASDTTLGTNAFIDRLQAHLIHRFRTMHNIEADISRNARAVAKFRREAIRVFKILSANKEIQASVEEVYNGLDLQVKVSRLELEAMCADLVARVPLIIQAALHAAATSPAATASTLSDIREVIVFGGGSRIPIIQSAILSATKMQTLGKNVNSDEAAAMGAIYQAASNTRGFLVKKIVLRGSTRYPLAVTLPRIPSDNDTDSSEGELITRVLFPASNPFPQKRTIKFPRPQKDISFQVHYSEAPENLSRYLNRAEAVMNVSILDVKAVIEKFEESGHLAQAVKTHLELDASGILQLSEVNLIMTHEEQQNKSNGTTSTLKKFADGISNLFGSGERKASEDKAKPPDALEQTRGDNETQPLMRNDSDATAANATATAPQTKTLIHPLSFQVQILDLVSPPVESVGASMAILREYDAADNERDLLNAAKNDLERTIFTTLSDIEISFDNHATEAELEALSATVDETSRWYDEEGHYAPRSVVEEHLAKLREVVDPYKRRVRAFAELPAAMTKLEELLTSKAQAIGIVMRANSALKTVTASEFVQALNETLEKEEEEKKVGLPIYTQEEVDALRKLIAETQTWLMEMRTLLANCDRRADPPVRLVTVTERTAALDAKLDYFGHKGEIWFTTYKRLFDIKKFALAEAARKAEIAGNATAENATVVEAPQVEEEQSATEESETIPEPKTTTPRSDLAHTHIFHFVHLRSPLPFPSKVGCFPFILLAPSWLSCCHCHLFTRLVHAVFV
ncbi:Heat shock protein Hsp70 [Echinococcus multilocularis]|uniref:Hypoxia up-regulated protein 1 n=1 Tax=Echinococcus multilocularis TaxID=6211 RepID=A0A068YFL2_ECHMU|nr:Heat shock protein Hsp70 [Echinococcus multilocularis]